ncbi:MAG TPA: DNA-processing protein DprA [Methylibium sp.]|uniref:DNA-processing protein DprA n=1 Tax=Methylibium sp. TaxID=2067992 RepID=UPI002DB57952|nr:DNA-processing protein DprA [Methylibium sp.]HEU4458720.1 DNA-processing protein DprA [Methylibium sp.]
MLEPEELAAWLRLAEAPGIGREAARQLLVRHGSAEAAVARVGATKAPDEAFDRLLAATRAWLDAAEADAPRHIFALGDPAYPQAWLEAPDPPLLVYAIGRVELLHAPTIAIVGSRNPTPQGEENARQFAAAMSRAGLTIVSGLALGIDGKAHAGGLEGPGSTIAIVGTGLDRVYPKRHLTLAHRIAREGLIVSDFPVGMPALAQNFPQRNRLIAGLARGTLVVEAALASGSLITARLAVEAGREVFALPGSIHSPQSRGCHALIKQGAKLVERAEDILDELRWVAQPKLAPQAAPAPVPEAMDDDPLLAALGHEAATLDQLCLRTGIEPATLSAKLLDLELAGRVARLPGQSYQRVVRA